LVDKFEIITQNPKLKDSKYFELSNTLNEVKELCFKRILPYWDNLIVPPIMQHAIKGESHDEEFFKGTNYEYYLEHHLQKAHKKEGDYLYHLRESYRCLNQNPELRENTENKLIEPYIKLITDLETHTKKSLIRKNKRYIR